MVESIVIKFGGSVLRDESTMGKAADMVREVYSRGLRPLVVVSAFKGATDSLLNLTRKVNPDVPPPLMDEVLSMGERTSARVFSAALSSRGLRPVLVDPAFDNWPIVTNGNHLDADPLYSETAEEVKKKIVPLLEEGRVPVVCGFIGKNVSGEVTTLGRGGSDTTALLLGSCLRSKEIVLVKDVETVFSSDPDVVENPVPLHTLDSEEAYILSTGGAKFLHSKALMYNRSGVRVRIASLEDYGRLGTIIDGEALNLTVRQLPEPVTMITIVSEKALNAEELHTLMNEVRAAGETMLSMTLDPKSTLLYVTGGRDLVGRLHKLVVEGGLGKAVSFYEDLRMVVIKGPALETAPGLIQRVAQPFARKNINIFGIVTISSSIRIFLSKSDADEAVDLLKAALLAREESTVK